MGDTLADLYREAGLSPAWRNTPEANSPPRRPMPRQMRARLPNYADVQRELPRGEAYAPPTNQIAGAGQQALEMTGLPSVRRSARAFTNGDPRTGAEEGALGLLGVAGVAGLVPRGRAPLRPMAAAEAPAIAPRPEPRLPGRASDGSVLPVRPREPFRNSLRGGSEDLAGAARMGEGAGPRTANMDRLLHSATERYHHGETATVHQAELGGRPLTMYDFNKSPARTNVRFQVMPDRQTYTVAMSASGAEGASVSTKAQAFADSIAAIEHHAMRNNARRRGFRYLLTGETDAHTRLFRGIMERAKWPSGAVIHDTPAGFEISFDAQRAPFAGELPFNDFAHSQKYRPNLGQQGTLRLSDTINNRSRQIADQATERARLSPPPNQPKSSRRPKPPSGGFLLPRRP